MNTEERIGKAIYHLIMMVISIVPLWLILTLIKDRLIRWWKRKKLLGKGILAMNSWYKINGSIGKVTYIGIDSVHLEGNDGSVVHVPIEQVCDSIITSIREPK